MSLSTRKPDCFAQGQLPTLSMHAFLCLFVCLSVCSFVCLFVCLFVRLSVCSFVCLFVCLFVRLFNVHSSRGVREICSEIVGRQLVTTAPKRSIRLGISSLSVLSRTYRMSQDLVKFPHFEAVWKGARNCR